MLDRLLQIRRGESTRAALLFAYLFLVIASFVVTKTTRDALFLAEYGAENLPYADIAAAVSVGAAMAVYLRISRQVGLHSLIIGTLVVCSATNLGFWALSSWGESSWILPVLYVWASVTGVLLPAQVWTLANHVVTTREAKRLFGIIAGGAVSGWIVGGLITRATAMSFGTENLLLMAAAALAMCPALVAAIWRERKIDPAEVVGREGRHGLAESLGMVWRSPHLRAIAVLIGLSSLVTTVVAWQFRAMAHAFRPDTDELAAFFGTFNIYAGALSLVAQFFLTSRLLTRFGLGVALLSVPVALTAGSLGVLLSGSLWSAVLLKGSDQVLRYSVDRSSVELLYLPVPARLMAHAKAIIDTVVWRIGDGVGAVLVLVAVVTFGLGPSQISAVTLVLLLGWIAAAVAAKGRYVENLRNSIYEHRVDAERLSAQVCDRSTTDVLADALGADNPDDILYALTLLEVRDALVSHEAVRRLLDHRSPEVRQKAISVLAAADDATVLPRVELLLRDEDPGVRAEALVYLARLSDVDPLARLAEIDQIDQLSGTSVVSAIAQFLARPGPAQKLDAVRILLDTSLAREGPEGHQARLEAARLIGSLPDYFNDQLTALLKDIAPDVVRHAMRAAATLEKVSSAPLVLPRLADPELSADAADALVALGDGVVPALRTALGDDRTPPMLRQAIPDVLQRMATPAAEQVLVEHLLDPDPVLRLRTVTALNKLRQLNPDRRLERELVETVLSAEILGHYRSYQLLGRISVEAIANEPALKGLKESMGRELERIFRLMKLLLPEHDLHSAYIGLQSGKAVVHANALEFLEQALPVQMRNLLLPLIDSEVSLGERMRIADRMVGATVETSVQALAAFAACDELLRDAARHAEQRLAVEIIGVKSGSH